MDMCNQDNAAEFAGTMDSTAAEWLQSLLPLAETDRPEITDTQKWTWYHVIKTVI